MIDPPAELRVVCCQGAVVTGGGLAVAVVEVDAADVAVDGLVGVDDGLVGVDELVRDVVPGIVVVVVGCSVVEIRIEVEVELGDAAMTPVSGWSFTAERAALTAT